MLPYVKLPDLRRRFAEICRYIGAMAMNNPAFSRNPAFSEKQVSAQDLQEMYDRPVAGEAMTVEDTVAKTALNFVLLVAGAAIGWYTAAAMPLLFIGAAIVGFVLALVNIFKREPSPGLILGYSAAQGIFLGGISLTFESAYPGIVSQAVIATFAVIGVTLALFASGKVRASARATKVFMIAIFGYLAYSIVNVFVMMFGGANGNPFGLSGDVQIFGIPLGVVLGIVVVLLAAYSLVLDFDAIQRGVANRADKKYGWSAAFGIMVTVIWLYTEILRMLAIIRD